MQIGDLQDHGRRYLFKAFGNRFPSGEIGRWNIDPTDMGEDILIVGHRWPHVLSDPSEICAMFALRYDRRLHQLICSRRHAVNRKMQRVRDIKICHRPVRFEFVVNCFLTFSERRNDLTGRHGTCHARSYAKKVGQEPQRVRRLLRKIVHAQVPILVIELLATVGGVKECTFIGNSPISSSCHAHRQ